jgi:uridine kinase
MTFKIFIEVELDTMLKRRIKRDLIARGYVDEKSIVTKDTEYVRPTFSKFIEPTKESADILIQNDDAYDFNTELNPFISWAEKIVEKLKEKLS